MTPRGVEHVLNRGPRSMRRGVEKPMTPRGVEHPNSGLVGVADCQGGEADDAERR